MMKASSSFAAAHNGSSAGSSRLLPLMLEPICAPFSPSVPHRPAQLVGGQLRRLHRQRRDAYEPLRIGRDGLGDLLVLQGR